MPTLHWIGKEKIINHHQEVPFKILDKQYTYSNGQQNPEGQSENKIIHGDNLEALKSLLPEYEGKVDCIYIDPPYNTGNEGWAYNDNVSHPKFKKWLGEVVGKEGEDLSRHDKWLCMMYPRLKLLKKLLTKNGALVISIGYHEVANLIKICEELVSDKQIITITVQTSGGKPSRGFNYQHEYLIFIVPNNFEAKQLLYSGGNSRSPFEGLTLATFDKTQRPNQTYPIFIDKKNGSLVGTGKSLQERIKDCEYKGALKDFQYDYSEAPEGTMAVWPITSKGKQCVWRLIASRLEEDWKKGYIKISPNKSKKALNKYSIQYLPSGVIRRIKEGLLEVIGTEKGSPTLLFGENKTAGGHIPTIWVEKAFNTVKGSSLFNNILKGENFNYPKPLEIIAEVLRATTSKTSIVLDSFGGSGTTAHAVLNLNQKDNGKRKFILVEMEDYAEDITAERVKRVIKGYGEGKNEMTGTGGDFSFYKLGQPLFKEKGVLNEQVGEEEIRKYVWFSETKSDYRKQKEPYLLGKKEDTAYYFYYKKDNLTTLDENFLRKIKTRTSQYIVYADNCLLDKELMDKYHIIFKKIPRDITRF